MTQIEISIGNFSFSTEGSEQETVLDVLEKLSAATKDFPHYRHSCHHGSCGTCGAIISGVEALMCLTRISDLMKDRTHPLGKETIAPVYHEGRLVITLEPLKKATLIDGIAVHPGRLFAAIPADTSYKAESVRQDCMTLEADPSYEELYRQISAEAEARSVPAPQKTSFIEAARKRNKLELCIECGLCFSACPEEFRGPAGLSAIHAELKKLPAGTKRSKLLLLANASDGVAGCKRHIACSRVCPQGVAPARRIQELKTME